MVLKSTKNWFHLPYLQSSSSKQWSFLAPTAVGAFCLAEQFEAFEDRGERSAFRVSIHTGLREQDSVARILLIHRPLLGGMTMKQQASMFTFAEVDLVSSQVDSIPGPQQTPPYSATVEIESINANIANVDREAWRRSPSGTLPIGDAMLSHIAGAVDISFAQHNRTNGSTVSLVHGNMVGRKLYSISIYPSRSIALWGRPSWEEMFEFTKANLDILQKPGRAIGSWFNDWGLVHVLDVVVLVRDPNVALKLGHRFNQLAIFNLETRREIPIPRSCPRIRS